MKKIFVSLLLFPFIIFSQTFKKDTLITYDGQKFIGDIIHVGKYVITFRPLGSYIYEKFTLNDIDSIFYKNGKHEKVIPAVPEIINKLKKTSKADKAVIISPISPFYSFINVGYEQFLDKEHIGLAEIHYIFPNKKENIQLSNNTNFRGGGFQLSYFFTNKEPLQYRAMSVRPKFQGFQYGPQLSTSFLLFDFKPYEDSTDAIFNIKSLHLSLSFRVNYTQVFSKHFFFTFFTGIGLGHIFPLNLSYEDRKKIYFNSEKIAYFKYLSNPIQFYGGLTLGFFFE